MTSAIGVKEITLDGQNVGVKWKDGHESEFTATLLRVNCSCAECVEEWSQKQLLDPASVPMDLRVEDYLTVGRYAVQFLWSDGHFTGIFPYEQMRALCQCNECKAARDA